MKIKLKCKDCGNEHIIRAFSFPTTKELDLVECNECNKKGMVFVEEI